MNPAGPGIAVRFATVADCALILDLVRELAAYERAAGAVVATENDLRRDGFGPAPPFEVLIAGLGGEPAGMALFYPRYSTWLGRPMLFLEDIVVREAARRHGVGRALFARLAAIALERGWARIDFHVLDWNPARDFYRRLGFDHQAEWLRYGAGEAELRRLAAEDRR